MKKYILAIFVLTSAAAFSQVASVELPSVYALPSLDDRNDAIGGDEALPFSHEGLTGKAQRAILTSGMVSGLGVGAFARMNYASSGISDMQFSTGYISMRQGAQSNLDGNGIFASVVPVFFGLRNDIATMKTRNMEWTQYVAYGAGPVMGVEYPGTFSFWQSVSRTSFRWGAGAYAGIGSELRFSQGLGMYAQAEYTAFGFTAPLRGKASYLGPSFSFGIMLVP